MAEELDLPPASAHTAQLSAVPSALKAVRLPALSVQQVQPVAQPEAVDAESADTDTEEAANV